MYTKTVVNLNLELTNTLFNLKLSCEKFNSVKCVPANVVNNSTVQICKDLFELTNMALLP